jgi:hypothetical protein
LLLWGLYRSGGSGAGERRQIGEVVFLAGNQVDAQTGIPTCATTGTPASLPVSALARLCIAAATASAGTAPTALLLAFGGLARGRLFRLRGLQLHGGREARLLEIEFRIFARNQVDADGLRALRLAVAAATAPTPTLLATLAVGWRGAQGLIGADKRLQSRGRRARSICEQRRGFECSL